MLLAASIKNAAWLILDFFADKAAPGRATALAADRKVAPHGGGRSQLGQPVSPAMFIAAI
jgi:hypothetical protein